MVELDLKRSGTGIMTTTAIEKSWPAVAPQLLTADGTSLGVVTVANSTGLKVKQQVIISASGLPDLTVKIMRFISPTQFYVGPTNPAAGQGLTQRKDISAYTVAGGAFVYAQEQPKVTIKPDDIWQAVYRQEPGTTIGVEIDDKWGNAIDSVQTGDGLNRLAVDAAITIESIEIGTVDQGKPNTPANAWPVEVYGPNGNPIEPNADGSINVNVVETPIVGQLEKSIYNEITSVANGVQTQIAFYTVPVGDTSILHRVDVSGDNFARYDVFLNGAPFDTKRTWFGEFNAVFEYTTGTNTGFVLNAGDTISVKVLHTRPFLGTFEARIQILEIS